MGEKLTRLTFTSPRASQAEIDEAWSEVRRGTLPLLPRHPKVRFYDMAGNAERFKTIFYQTWKRLPFGVRRRIIAYWRANWCCPWPDVRFSPQICVYKQLYVRDRGTGIAPTTVWGNCGSGGHRLEVDGTIIDKMPDAIACDLVAHELAHVFQHAAGMVDAIDEDGQPYSILPQGDALLPGEVENDADDLMVAWGFDDTAMDEWSSSVNGKAVQTVTFDELIDHSIRFLNTGHR
jgi:hypothetical protein